MCVCSNDKFFLKDLHGSSFCVDTQRGLLQVKSLMKTNIVSPC